MKKVLVILTMILGLIQIAIVVAINFHEKEFVSLSLNIANSKIQNEFDEEYARLNDNKLFQLGKSIASTQVKNLDGKLDEAKALVKLESQKVLDEIDSGIINYQEATHVEFDLLKLARDKDYAVIYFRSYLLKSLKALRRDLNIMFVSNLLLLVTLLIVTFKKYEYKIGRGLSWIALISVIISSVVYFLGQNWLYSILMNSYYGFAYSALLGVIFLTLVDVAFNRCRVLRFFNLSM